MNWYIETLDRDDVLHQHYRQGTYEEAEESMWLDFPDRVVVAFENAETCDDKIKELDFNDVD